MRRDTYHDFVTDAEQRNSRGLSFDIVGHRREAELTKRSGILNVTNWRVTKHHDVREQATQISISFDSRAWTGLA